MPALKALRDANVEAGIEILAYPHIASIADRRFYAEAVRSIEYAALSRFFARGAELPSQLRDYFAGFDLILSYLYDPDGIFQENLRRCGAKNLLFGPAKILPGRHASEQLAQPLQQLGINVTALEAKIFPSEEDRQIARRFLESCHSPVLAVHPGSGSERKNWPIESWIELIRAALNGVAAVKNGSSQTADRDRTEFLSRSLLFGTVLVISGEADQTAMRRLQTSFAAEKRVRFAHQLPLPHLAAILSQCTFVGHDSGISHLAAAAGARSTILFGPTDPTVWAPRNNDVTALQAPAGDLNQLPVSVVLDTITR